MEKACLHCKQRLSFLRAVRGELFCSSDHRELYLQAEAALAFERVAFFDNPSPHDREAAEAPEVQPAHVGTKKAVEAPPPRVTTPPVAEVKPEPARVIEMAKPTPAPLHDASPSVPEATAPVVPEPGELVSMTTRTRRRTLRQTPPPYPDLAGSRHRGRPGNCGVGRSIFRALPEECAFLVTARDATSFGRGAGREYSTGRQRAATD